MSLYIVRMVAVASKASAFLHKVSSVAEGGVVSAWRCSQLFTMSTGPSSTAELDGVAKDSGMLEFMRAIDR